MHSNATRTSSCVVSEQRVVDRIAKTVNHQQMALLDAGGSIMRYAELHVRRREHRADPAAALRPQAVLVNIARGPLLDEPALIEALRAGRLRISRSRAASIAETTLAEFPDVDIARRTSPAVPSARTCFANT